MKKRICGVDSVGIGSLAGPVVSGAVIFKKSGVYPVGLNDSKKLTPKQREYLVPKIKKMAFYGFGRVGPKIIDRINIYQADSLAMERAIKNIKKKPSIIYIDGKNRKIRTKYPYVCIVRGDESIPEVMASSILVKVQRDNLMCRYAKKYPRYQWHRNKGYGTLEHRKKLSFFGPSPIHRMSFRPLKNWYKSNKGKA